MAKGSFGVWNMRAPDLNTFFAGAQKILDEQGYRIRRRRKRKGEATFEAIHGRSLTALLAQFIPFVGLLGWGSRVLVRIKARTSLDKDDDAVRVVIRCTPIRELEDQEETLFLTQDVGEHVGDNLQARRFFRRLIDALSENNLIEQFPTRRSRR